MSLFGILLSGLVFADPLALPNLRIEYAQTAPDSKDREIGIERYCDPKIFPMIGWRGMIIETNDGDSTYYVKVSKFSEALQNPPEFNPGGLAYLPIGLSENRYSEGPNDQEAYRFHPNLLDRWFETYNMDFDLIEFDFGTWSFGDYTIVQKFSEGTPNNGRNANKHYAFIPSRVHKGIKYRKVIESPLHTTGTTIYYRWWKGTIVDGEENLIAGDIHSFVNPRKIAIAMFGDSFGSGEGAPNRNSRSP